VDADPIDGAGNRPVDYGNHPAVGRFIDEAERLAGGDLSHDVIAIVLRVALQAAAVDPIADEVDQRRSGLHGIRREPVHGAILVIADDQPAAGVEQHDALRHVVQSQSQQCGVGLPGPADDQTIDDPQHRVSRLKAPLPRA
jgi:hypothetical protein